MDDHELIQRFIKIERKTDNISLLVHKVGWSGSHTPMSTWELAVKFKVDVSPEEIDVQICKALNNEQYFQVCKECGERQPCGWMHGRSICQSCAQRNHDIAY